MGSVPPVINSDDDLLASDDSDFEAHLLRQLDAVVHSTKGEDGHESKPSVRYTLPKPEAKGDYRDGDEYGVTGFGEGGLYLRNKRRKLAVQQEAFVKDNGGDAKPQFFKGLAVYINGYTKEATVQELSRLLTLHGGVYVPYLDRKTMVTHIVASELTPKKRLEFRAYKIATPRWILDSVEAGKLLDWKRFALLAAEAATPATTSRFGYDNAESRLGTQKAQPSIFGMLGKKRQLEEEATSTLSGKAPKRLAADPQVRIIDDLGEDKASSDVEIEIQDQSTTRSTNVETIESLSERGRRLAEAAIATELSSKSTGSAATFFQPRSAGQSPSKPKSPTKSKQQVFVPSTDPIDGVVENHPYLPRRTGNARTTALLDDPEWMAKNTSAADDYVQKYFAQSRLHHISTWKEELKALVATLQPASTVPQRTKKLTGLPSDERTILHVDFDCFFVSAGLTKRPDLRGKPVAVCHAQTGVDSNSSTSEIASCSYEARDMGVKNGMSLGRARELCPAIKTIPFDFELYKSIASKFYAILLKHAVLLQAVSIDEVLMEVEFSSGPTASQDPLLDYAHGIRAEIFEATGCSASIGISHNILLARLASRKAKPASAFHLVPDMVASHLEPLDVDALPGIGWSTRDKLKEELDITTVGDLLKTRPSELARVLGKQNGEKFALFAKGIDARELDVGKARQSVSTEVNYGIRFDHRDQVRRFMLELGIETARRLKEIEMQARKLTLKVMQRHPDAPVETPKFLGHGWCVTQTASSAIAGPGGKATDDGQIVGHVALDLIMRMDVPVKELRGIAIQLSKLEKNGRSVDAVLEKGQGQLSFAVTIKGASTGLEDKQITPSPGKVPEEPVAGPSRPRSPSTSDPVSPLESPPPPPPPARRQLRNRSLPKDPSIIILDDSDDDVRVETPLLPPSKPAPIPIGAKSPGKFVKGKKVASVTAAQPVVPAMFRPRRGVAPPPAPTTSQTDEEELQHYGFDVETFRELPRETQSELLTTARKARFAPRRPEKATTPFGVIGLVTKPGLDTGDLRAAKSRSRSEPVPIPIIELPPTPPTAPDPQGDDPDLPKFISPTTATEDQLKQLQIDPEWLKGLPLNVQREQMRNRALNLKKLQRLTVASDRSSSKTGGAGSIPGAGGSNNVVQVTHRPEVRFQKRSKTDDVLPLVEVWCSSSPDSGPEASDVDRVARFLERCVEREKGHDVKKAMDVLKWWAIILEEEHGREGEAGAVGRIWWERYRDVVERVQVAVKREYGSSLVL